MINFTFNNHLSYSIGSEKFSYRTTCYHPYHVSVGAIDEDHFKTSSYQDELRRTADLVSKDLGSDLVVFLSGGTDSEIVVRNFLDIGIKPRCATIKFSDGYNDQDVIESVGICRELDLKLDVIEFDVTGFYHSGEAKEFAESLQCSQLTYLTIYKNILDLGFPAVMGGEVLLSKYVSNKDMFWYYTFRENEDASAMRFSMKYDIPLINEWFSYTPELLLFYLEDQDIQRLVSDQIKFKLTSASSKNSILKRLYPSVRDKSKTHGFERLMGLNLEAYRNLNKDTVKRYEGSVDGIPINKIMEQLRNDH